jgi:hypothetical protein
VHVATVGRELTSCRDVHVAPTFGRRTSLEFATHTSLPHSGLHAASDHYSRLIAFTVGNFQISRL